jgi:hypothetical protein
MKPLIPCLLLALPCLLWSGTSLAGTDQIFADGFDPPQWVNVTGPNFWQCSANCSLVNGAFVEAGPGMTLTTVGTWANGFRPRAVRVNASLSPMFSLGVGLAAGGIDFGVCSNYVVQTPCALQVTADIQRINLYISGTISSIEFLR